MRAVIQIPFESAFDGNYRIFKYKIDFPLYRSVISKRCSFNCHPSDWSESFRNLTHHDVALYWENTHSNLSK